jgi:putative ABC transport system permease protein
MGSVRRIWQRLVHSFRLAVATLAVGIGVTSAMFSVVDAVLLKPLPYAEADRLVQLWESNPAEGRERVEV